VDTIGIGGELSIQHLMLLLFALFKQFKKSISTLSLEANQIQIKSKQNGHTFQRAIFSIKSKDTQIKNRKLAGLQS